MGFKYKSLITLLAFPILLNGQVQNLKFEHLTVEGGLSSSRTNSIMQDSRGFIWIATYDGLNKFDGYQFTTYRNDPADSNSLSNNNVIFIHEDSQSNLWLTTLGGGLNKFDVETEKFKHYLYNPDDETSISGNDLQQVRGHKYDDREILWIGGANGLNRFDLNTEEITRYPIPGKEFPENYIEAIIVDSAGIAWIGCNKGGLYKFNPATERFTHYRPVTDNPDSLSGGSISWLCLDKSGMLWVGTRDGGLNKFNRHSGNFSRYTHDPANPNSLGSNYVATILEDRAGIIWIGTADGGLNRFDRENEHFFRYEHDPGDPYSIGDQLVISLLEDNSGVLWAATWKGISKTDPGKAQFYDIKHNPGNPNSLTGNFIMSVCESDYGDNLNLWVGTKADGLNRIERRSGKVTRYTYDPAIPNGISNNTISALYEDKEGMIWIGTYGSGLHQFNYKTKQFKYFQNNPEDQKGVIGNVILCIKEDKSGSLWIGTYSSGLNKFDRKTGKFVLHGYRQGVQSIIEDGSGILWYGGFSGLQKLNYKTGEHSEYVHSPDKPNSISNNNINIIYESRFRGKDVLWVGTESGLNRFDPEEEKFFCYTTDDGLASNMINGILEDEMGHLWLSTNNGLSRFDTQFETFRNYDVHDGLLSNQFYHGACFKSNDGALFFGGVNGLNYFYPDQLKDNNHPPKIVLTGFNMFNQPVLLNKNNETEEGDAILSRHISFAKEIFLTYRENIFSFEFAALDFRSPLKNKYAYKMEGVDPEWVYVDASRRFATYTNLDPGTYIFKVKGSNNDGIWNKTGTSIKVIITPPWWETNLAYAFYILLFMSISYITYRLQLKRIHLRQQMQMRHFEAEKLREVDHIKSRFFANISHEFRTPLTLILGPVRQMLSGEFSGNFKEQYKMIIRSGERLLHLINQLLDLSKLESGKMKLQAKAIEIVRFTNSLSQAFESLAVRRQIHLKFSAEPEMQEIYLDPEKYETVINNLLSNAFKATPDSGAIEVNLTPLPLASALMLDSGIKGVSEGYITISISNTGPGIPPDQLDHIFDRFYQANNSYKKDEEGSGIGLALTRELVELHHGKIHVESNPEVKTTFSILLPLGKAHLKQNELSDTGQSGKLYHVPEPATIPDKVEESNEMEIIDHHPKTSILIIEDNADLRRHICINMNHAYSIIEAENGEKGFGLAIKISPTLIISDVMMPVMDGFEFCKKIKTDERTSHIPVILLTARAGQEDKIEGLESGADAYVTKPFDIRELKIRVKNLIEQRSKLREKFTSEIDFPMGNMSLTSADEKFVKQLMEIISHHISDTTFHTDTLAREVGMSRTHLHRKIKGLFGQSPGRFLRTVRLKQGAQLLRKKTGNISEIAYNVGFDSPAYFSGSFRKQFGLSPSEYQKKSDIPQNGIIL